MSHRPLEHRACPGVHCLVRCRGLIGFLFVVGLIWSGWVRSSAAPAASEVATLDREAEQFFAGPVQRFEITTTRAAASKLRSEPRESVEVTVTVGDRRFENVAMHLKGAAGSFRPFDDRPALTLNFDKFQPGQFAFGLDKLHLNNSVQDESYLNELIASTLYRRIGVPTARSTFALVTLNGRNLGLYVLKEGYNARFVRRHFPGQTNGLGNLYDGGFLQDVNQELDRDAGKGPEDRRDLAALVKAADQPLARRAKALEAVLDVDRFLTFLVGQTLTDDWDGYGRNRNNYRVYCPPGGGRAVFIPHGMDQLFNEPGSSIDPGWAGLVASQAMEVPEFRERYRQMLVQITTNHFTAALMSNQVQQVSARLEKAFQGRPAEDWMRVKGAMRSQQARILRRVSSVWRQLGLSGPGVPTLVPAMPEISEWESRPRQGRAVIEVEEPKPGEPALHLGARGRGTIASFRTRVWLGPGSYTFSAAARGQGIRGGKGAGLRISGSQRGPGLSGDRDWTALRYDFALDSERDVELVVELDADAGDVWFDPTSFKLTPR